MKSPKEWRRQVNDLSQPARAVWIEIWSSFAPSGVLKSHSLRGLCGLKYRISDGNDSDIRSQPARAVWIEIFTGDRINGYIIGHSLRGLCGLK